MDQPQQLGKYTILEKIGEGGFGTVYRAQDATLERIVALKVLKPMLLADPVFVERFQREAKAAAALEHPHIVTIYEIGQDQGLHFLAMRYLGTDALDRLLERQGALAIPRALNIARQIADALDYAHARGMIHRDVKPSNILIGAEDAATLTDFGLVRSIEGSVLSSSQQMVGTIEYMAPEQLDTDRANEIGARTDLYAFGILVYQMVTGRVPFAGSTSAVMASQLYKEPPPPSQLRTDLPRAMEIAILKMLAKPSAERFARGKDFVDALERGKSTLASPPKKPAIVQSPVAPTVPKPPKEKDIPTPLTSSPKTHKSRPSALNTCAVIAVLTACVLFGMLSLFGVMSSVRYATPTKPVVNVTSGTTDSAGRATLAKPTIITLAKPTAIVTNAYPYTWSATTLVSSGSSAIVKLATTKRARVQNISAELYNLLPGTIYAWVSANCQDWVLAGSVDLSSTSNTGRAVPIPVSRVYVDGTYCVSINGTPGSATYIGSNMYGDYLIKVTLIEE